MKLPKLGAHVSTAGGLYRCIDNAQAIGAETIQIFGASPQQWKTPLPLMKEVKKYQEFFMAGGVQSVYLHGAYLVNLASPDDILWEKSIINLTAHLKIAELLKAEGVIFHVGSGKETNKTAGIARATKAVDRILKSMPGKACLIMENSASAKKVGATAEEMATILDGVNSKRVKICLDTAHAFEAGLIEQYTPADIKKFCDYWDRVVGLENVVVLHINDSKTAFLSNHDRHENIGAGHIGLAGFKNLAQEKRLWDKAWILEVPGFDNLGPDKKNIDILRSCFAGE